MDFKLRNDLDLIDSLDELATNVKASVDDTNSRSLRMIMERKNKMNENYEKIRTILLKTKSIMNYEDGSIRLHILRIPNRKDDTYSTGVLEINNDSIYLYIDSSKEPITIREIDNNDFLKSVINVYWEECEGESIFKESFERIMDCRIIRANNRNKLVSIGYDV